MQIVEHRVEIGCGRFMHHDGDRQVFSKESMGTEYFEASQMGPQKNAAALLLDGVLNDRRAFHADVEIAMPSRQKIDSVVDRRSKRMIVTKDIPPARRALEDALQILSRHPPGSAGEHDEIQTDGIQKPPRHGTAHTQGHPGQQSDEDQAAAFGLTEPVIAHRTSCFA
jgi:hypothetical protein